MQTLIKLNNMSKKINFLNFTLDKVKIYIININMKLPERCPFCGREIEVREFACGSCGSVVRGCFECGGMFVSEEQWEFVRLFIRVRGNLKRIGEILDLSYPTVRARLEEVRRALGFPAYENRREEVITELERGHIDVNEALGKLKEINNEGNEG